MRKPKFDLSSGGEGINYVVTGLGRSGTTYMMRCIEAGGIPVINQKGHRYEFAKSVRAPALKEYKGWCFKLFSYDLILYDVSKCAIIFMKRNPYKILVSYIRLKKVIPHWLLNCVQVGRKGWRLDVSAYYKKLKECADCWKKDAFSYIECDIERMQTYEDRIEFFAQLKEKGWPINVEKAALVENDEEERIQHTIKGSLAW
jgi:hypothetical protein